MTFFPMKIGAHGYGLLACFVLGLVTSCGLSASGQPADHPTTRLTAATKNDESRCEFQGRLDREVAEAVGNGAQHASIRRVFAFALDGERSRGVLLCREVDTNHDGIKDVVRFYDDEGRKTRERADSDHNGKPDTWIRFAKGYVVRVELDLTGNGAIDETRFYLKGKLSRIQLDTNGDGKPDVWEMYSKGHLDRIGQDLNFDGRVNRWSRDEQADSEKSGTSEGLKRTDRTDAVDS